MDDHPLARAGLTALLGSTDDLHVAGEASGGEQAVLLSSELEPDVVRMDLSIGRALGITERTVKVHVGHVFRSIGVSDRTSAAMWARDHLPPDPSDDR